MENVQLLKMAIEKRKFSQFFGKYRTIEQTKEFLGNSKLYFSKYEKFNDPFELSSILEYSCTSKDEFTFFKKVGVPIPFIPYARKNKKYFIEKAIDDINKEMGILCGTTKENNLLMWAHYADSHKGTFLLFDILQDPDVFFYPRKVIYDNDFIHIDYFKEQLGDKENLIKPLFHKSKDWEYEKEIRIVDMLKSGAKQVNKRALIKIVFGCRASVSDIYNIEKICKDNHFDNVNFYKAKKNEQKYQLDIIPL